jgi:hypothetical protein
MLKNFAATGALLRKINNFKRICGCKNITSSTSSSSIQNVPKTSPGHNYDWNQAVDEAEKIVKFSTTTSNLRWLLTDDITNLTLHMRKLIGSDHPLLDSAK